MNNGFGKTLSMLPSTQMFAEEYGNPFLKLEARMAVYPVLPTQSTHSTVRSVMKTNSNGYGWVYLTPQNGLTNDIPCLNLSSAAGASDSPAVYGSGGTTSSTSNSVYSVSDFDSVTGTKVGRLYAVGLRIAYKGTTLESAGRCYCVQTTLRDSVLGYTVNAIEQNQTWKSYPVNNSSWHSLTRHLTSELDSKFTNYVSAQTAWFYESLNPNVYALDSDNNMLILVQASPNIAFEVEAQFNFEIKGKNLRYHAVTTSDPIGHAKVVEGYAKLRALDNVTKDHSVKNTLVGSQMHAKKTFIDTVKDGIGKAIPIIEKIAPIATTMLGLL